MKRTNKYPDTKYFHYFNANPKNRITTDCVVRALSRAMDMPYNQVVFELAEFQCSTGYDEADSTGIGKYLESKGWVKHRQPRKGDNTKYTGSEFCALLAEDDVNYIANIGGHHIVAIVNQKVNDIWDSTGKSVGNYWTKGAAV